MALPPFQRIADQYWHEVALLTSALAGPQDAAAAARSTWEQALATYPDAPDARYLKAWLLHIATRAAVNAHRARQRRHVPAETEVRRTAPAADSTDDRTWSQVRALPERERTALVLHYVGGVPHAEIAAIMGTTVTTTRRWISDALRSLRAPSGVREGATSAW